MNLSYLDEENIYDIFTESKDHTERLTEPFPEYSRIARNKPHPRTPERFPKTTDGTSASIISKTPRRAVQQHPTGVIESENEHSPWPIIADFVGRTKILPYANTEYDLLQKCWNTMEDGATFGSKAVYTPMIDHDGEVTPDYLPIYWGDIFVQPGKRSGYDCNYLFMRTWYQKSDIEEIIDTELAKKKDKSYESFWDLEALKEIVDATVAKDDKARTPSEDQLQLDPSGIEIVTAFQKGVGAVFYTFNPSKKLIVRRKPNLDPRGKMPIDWYYDDVDGSNPLGRSLLEYIGPLQNLIDSDMQAYQYNRALSLQPPLIAKGNINEKRIVFAPNAVNKVTDPNGSIDAMTIDTSAIRDYPNIYGLQISQLMKNTNGDPATAISSEVGDPMAGKTPTAIKARSAATSTDDNATRKNWEAFFENWYETAINLYFAERSGKELLQLDGETADKLRDLEKEGHLPAGYVRDDNTIIVDYDSAVEVLRFRVDAETSKVSNSAAQLESLQVLVQTLDSSQSLSSVVPIDKKLEVWNAIVANSGVDKPERLKVSEEELDQLQQEMAAQMPVGKELVDPGQQIEGLSNSDMPEGELAGLELPPEGYDTTEDDAAIASILQRLGVPDDMIAEVPEMIDKGYSDDEVMAAIQGELAKREEMARV